MTRSERRLENLKAQLQGHRMRLVQMMNDGEGAVAVSGPLDNMAEIEGGVFLLEYVVRLEKAGHHQHYIMTAITEVVLRGADDSWSGRRNDVSRSRYDGVLAEARHYQANMERGV